MTNINYIYGVLIVLLIVIIILCNKHKTFIIITAVLLYGIRSLYPSSVKKREGNFEKSEIVLNILNKIINGKYSINIMLDRIKFISNNANDLKPNFSCITKTKSDDNTNIKYLDKDKIIKYYNNDYICIYNKKSDNDTKLYRLKSNLKDIITTSYMNAITNTEFKNYVFHILKFLNDGLRLVEKLYNTKNNTNIINNYYVIYKGGNVINTYFKLYLDQLKSYRKHIVKFNNFIDNIMKKGDWDFSVKIIKHHNEMDDIAKNTVLYMLSIINNSIGMNINNVNSIIQKNIFNKNVENMLYEFNKSINSHNKIYIKNVKTPFGIITKNNIYDQRSYDYEKSGIAYLENTTKSSYMTVDSFINTDNILVENIAKTIFIKNLNFIKNDHVISFDLARVKISNNAEIFINGRLETVKLPAEVIDVSFINDKDDVQQKSINDMVKNDGGIALTFINHKGYKYPFYTPDFLFADLTYILFIQEVYPWVDRKYEKRLKRYITMGIVYDLSKNNAEYIKGNIHNIYKILLPLVDVNINDALPYLTTVSKKSCLSKLIHYIINMVKFSRHINNIEETEYSRNIIDIKNNPSRYADPNLFNNSTIPVNEFYKTKREDIIQFNIFIKNVCSYLKQNIDVLMLLGNNFKIDISKLTYVQM